VKRLNLSDMKDEIRHAYSDVGNLVHALCASGFLDSDDSDDAARCMLRVVAAVRGMEMRVESIEREAGGVERGA
jgi:hypothetical protein